MLTLKTYYSAGEIPQSSSPYWSFQSVTGKSVGLSCPVDFRGLFYVLLFLLVKLISCVWLRYESFVSPAHGQ